MLECVVGRLTNLRDHPSPGFSHLQVGEFVAPDHKGDESRVLLVVGRHYEEGNLGFFVPDGAVVPRKLLEEMWLWNPQTGKGRLAGKRGDRVKAREVGGAPSEGLFYGAYYFHEGSRIESPSWDPAWRPGDTVTERVGVEVP